MGTKHRTHLILGFVLWFVLMRSTAASSQPRNEGSKYLDAVREFADNVLLYGKDTYGPKHTPLFVDGLNVNTHEPVKWINPDGSKWVLSNFASQQNLMRTLDGLSAITDDPKYRDAAMQATRYAFDNLRSPNGLFYWGGMAVYDALADRVCGPIDPGQKGIFHTTKLIYPYYELMWEVDPAVTKKFIEALWSAHIIDWSNLDMDRGPLILDLLEEPWNHEYKDGPIPFESKSNGRAMFITGSPLIYAGTTLYKLSNLEQPYVWSKRLAQRYVDTRHPKTGISASMYNFPWHPVGRDMDGHFIDPRTTVFPLVFSGLTNTIFTEDVQAQPWISIFLVGDMLGENGREFRQWALEELTAWGKAAYRKKDNSFVPMLTDGASLEGYVFKEAIGPYKKGNVVKPCFVDLTIFWGYTVAYRTTADSFMWGMAKDIAAGNSFGDIGETPTDTPRLSIDTKCSDVYGLMGFLELYAKTNKPEFLQMARRIGDNIIDEKFHKGFFVPSNKHIYTRFDCFEPLALLHLYGKIKPTTGSLPVVWPHYSVLAGPYRYKERGDDGSCIYALTESAEPPLSLDEAAAIGDVNMVSSLIEKGADVNALDDAILDKAIMRAVQNGHREVVELLLAKGARIGAKDESPGRRALHSAVQNGHKDIVELLIAKGADINAKDTFGHTPLTLALVYSRTDIAELLITKGVDVNTKDNNGNTPLHFALRGRHEELAKLILTKGVDINAKNSGGKTALDVALDQNQKDIIELLITKGADASSIYVAAGTGYLAKVKEFLEKGADVNMRGTRRETALHIASANGHKEIVKLLLAHGADVNAGANLNRTAAEFAMRADHREIVELLMSKGADISPLHFALYIKDQAKAKSLIESGADVNRRTPYGTTPLHMAAAADFKDIAELLIAKGADVNAKDNYGWTPLHSAAQKGHKDIVELLLARGANVNAKDGGGRSPLGHAKEKGYTEIVELLRKHGAKE